MNPMIQNDFSASKCCKGAGLIENVSNSESTASLLVNGLLHCGVGNTKREKDIECFKIYFRRLIYVASRWGHKFKQTEKLIMQEFPEVSNEETGTINLDIILEASLENERFQKSLPADYHHPCYEQYLNTFIHLFVPFLWETP